MDSEKWVGGSSPPPPPPLGVANKSLDEDTWKVRFDHCGGCKVSICQWDLGRCKSTRWDAFRGFGTSVESVFRAPAFSGPVCGKALLFLRRTSVTGTGSGQQDGAEPASNDSFCSTDSLVLLPKATVPEILLKTPDDEVAEKKQQVPADITHNR